MKEIDNITINQNQNRKKKRAILITVPVSCLILFGVVFNTLNVSQTETLMTQSLDPGIIQTVAASTDGSNNNNDSPEIVSLDGVNLSSRPEINLQTGLATLNMNITDQETGKPLTHVDWLIKIVDPVGNKIFQSSTVHSHIGTERISFAPVKEGEYIITVQVASLGPKMMGMDVPAMAQTRIFQSGDPMMGWQTDPTFFFGLRNVEFRVNVDNQIVSNNIVQTSSVDDGLSTTIGGNGLTKISTTTADENNNKENVTLNASENGTKVNLEFTTKQQGNEVIAGEPVRLILNVKNPINGTHVTHPDALFTIKKGDFTLLQSAEAGSPMMPMNGAFHGHTGQIAFDTVFPEPGVYAIATDVNSLPVSNYVFGTASTVFDVAVTGGQQGQEQQQQALAQQQQQQNSSGDQPKEVSIVGQVPPFYNPNELTVKVGDTITFRNDDAIEHTATSTSNGTDVISPTPSGVFDTGPLMMGEEKQVTFDKEGTFNYFCTIHPFMRGSITVES